ncbi:Sec-independent protein translocase protein TATA, chloroplastic [Zea mays]|uniref:Sec-independent protein translocase protein TATA, chloroplastic n=1 Tax=Zea mays TaxID=4577 RepID=A0A317Y583_MAIZE|nr:Sec-independent protein translocase protein TATA, chloroplastic [Zea mays]
MGIPVVVPVAAAYSCSSSLAAPPRAAAAAARAPSRAHVAAAGMSSRASSFVGGSGGDLSAVAASVAARPRRAGSGGGGALGCKCLFGLGVPELAVIAGVAALVFGPKQLPEIGRSIGKTVKSFQQAAKEFETELKKEPGEGGDQPPPATPTAVSGGEEKGLEASSSKESA